jgi:deoxyguanosine kinase
MAARPALPQIPERIGTHRKPRAFRRGIFRSQRGGQRASAQRDGVHEPPGGRPDARRAPARAGMWCLCRRELRCSVIAAEQHPAGRAGRRDAANAVVAAAPRTLAVKGLYVALEGPTGVGKTTLATRLAAELDAIAVFDPFDANPFLARLLAAERPDEPLALRVELTFFALRIAQLREVRRMLAAGQAVVADWALMKQPIFAATTLDQADVDRVAATVEVWADSLPRPDVLIGLSAAAFVIRQRVRRRGRDMETSLTGAHLDQLAEAFEAAYATWDRPLIRVDTATFSTVDDMQVHELADQVRQLSIPLETR